MICVALSTVKVAGTPLKETPIADVKLVPAIVILSPTIPVAPLLNVPITGVGAALIRNWAETPNPPDVTTWIVPFEGSAAGGTFTVIVVSLLTTKSVVAKPDCPAM